MDADWRFALGHAYDTHKDFDYSTVPFFFAKAGYGKEILAFCSFRASGMFC
jgi:hypothetical protein